jgi:hypothetical protein
VLVLAAYGTAAYGTSASALATNGYVDVLWSGAFAAGCVFVLSAPQGAAPLRWGALCLAVAAMTKNEGLVAVALVVVLALVRYRFERPARRWLLGALGPGMAWVLVARLAGAPSEYLGNSKTTELLRLDRGVLRRFRPAFDGVWHQTSSLVIVAGGITVLGLLVLRVQRRKMSGTALPWMWLAWLITTSSVIYAYVVSPSPLRWHLLTSVDRTTIAPKMILLAESLLWASAALATLRRSSSRAGTREREQPPSDEPSMVMSTDVVTGPR